MEPGEVPLAYAHVCIFSRKLSQLSLYTLGFTDEALHIRAEYGLVPNVKFGSWRIPLGQVQSMATTGEGHIVIDLASPVIDPEDLDGPKTSRLRFKPWKQKDARRAARIIELFGKLKNGDLKKAEIAKTYFDKNSISYFGN